MQSIIFKSLISILALSALGVVSGCSEEQEQAAKNTADIIAKKADDAIEATKDVSSDAWGATKDATKSAADTVAVKTDEIVEATKDVSSDAWDATKNAAGSVENTASETLDSAKQAIQ